MNTGLGNVRRSLSGTCRRLQAKYADCYLGEFQYRFNRRYDLAALPGRMLQAAAATPP